MRLHASLSLVGLSLLGCQVLSFSRGALRPKQHRFSLLLFASSPSWSDLSNEMDLASPGPLVIDSLRDPSTPRWSKNHPTLIREREGWCPYSERVWLTLEHLQVDYDTVRIDNSGYGPRPAYYSGQTPQVRWPGEARAQGESMDLVYRVFDEQEESYDASRNAAAIQAWKSIMPQRSRPSSRAAFLFQYNGEPLWQSVLEECLEQVDALLLPENGGSFFGGATIGPADMCWAPFLERYRYQLPCLHEGLDPNDAKKYPNLAHWYSLMDTTVPAYVCRVKGNAASWRKVLSMAGFGNAGIPLTVQTNMDLLLEKELAESTKLVSTTGEQSIWKQYAETRPHVARTAHGEAARVILENREAIASDTQKNCQDSWDTGNIGSLDDAMKDLVGALMRNDRSRSTPGSKQLARFLTERMCVPRDMGCLPSAYIHVHGSLETD